MCDLQNDVSRLALILVVFMLQSDKMAKIQILPESLINKIAAGEVVERPASVVKELVENAIDAGSDQIFVVIKNGGKDFISVLDNGSGMSADDANLAIERHATSKIETNEDLDNITTMGFRGEALAAIAAVSRFELTTCGDEEKGGFQIRMEGGKIVHSARMGFPRGTRICVENLFFNTPARQKFMKSVNTEYNHVHDLIVRLALGNPSIQFRLTHNKNLVLSIPKTSDFKQRVEHCFGAEITDDLLECKHEESYLKFHGLISHPSKAKSSKRWQHTFVNGRYVKCQTINHGIYEGFKTLLMKHTHPAFFFNLELSPQELDVNVHPAKTEIRLKNANLVHTILANQVSLQLKNIERGMLIGSRDDEEIENTTNPFTSADSGEISIASGPAEEKPDVYVEKDSQLGFMPPEPVTFNPPARNKSSSKSESAIVESKKSEDEPFSFAKSEGLKPLAEFKTEIVDQETGFTIIGQLSNKYILVQGEDKLILVDQHAAHERIRFEEIKNQFFSNKLQTQPLLVPILIELPPQDGILLEQYQDSWKKLGFAIDHFGGNDYSVKEIPIVLKDADISNVIKEVLDEMAQFGKTGKLESFFNEVFEKVACHSAIRASQSLTVEEMKALINQLVKLDITLHCPHGRPVWIEFSLPELDRRFKR